MDMARAWSLIESMGWDNGVGVSPPENFWNMFAKWYILLRSESIVLDFLHRIRLNFVHVIRTSLRELGFWKVVNYLTVWGLLAQWWVGVGGVTPGKFWRSFAMQMVHSPKLWVHFVWLFYIDNRCSLFSRDVRTVPSAIGTTVWVGVGGVTPGNFWKSTIKIVHSPAFWEYFSRFFILKGCQCYLIVWGLLAQLWAGVLGVTPAPDIYEDLLAKKVHIYLLCSEYILSS